MKRRTVIKNAKIVTPEKILGDCSLVIENGKIAGFQRAEERETDCELYDAGGGYVLPGFIDLHVHGGGGYDFMDLTEESFRAVVAVHFMNGTTTILPTGVSAPMSELEKFFALYRRMKECTQVTLAGIHLEGPFISQAMRGAQNSRYIITPIAQAVEKMFDFGGDVIGRITAAPEIDGAEFLAKEANKHGVKLCIGHSNAVASDVIRAYDLGFTHITHLYCNTPSNRKINQRVYAGIVEAAYLLDGMTVELIGDGRHIAKETMQMVAKVKGINKTAIVSDAMRAAGTNVSESYLGAKIPENLVIIEDGVAKLPDRSYYAGSIATGQQMFRNAVKEYGLSITAVSEMMSLTPAKSAGLEKTKGSIELGKDADVIIMDNNFVIKKVLSVKQLQ